MTNCEADSNGSYGVYAAGDSSLVTDCRITASGGTGIQMAGLDCFVASDTVSSCTNHGIYLEKNPADFQNNLSTNNSAFGYIVPATVVDEV